MELQYKLLEASILKMPNINGKKKDIKKLIKALMSKLKEGEVTTFVDSFFEKQP